MVNLLSSDSIWNVRAPNSSSFEAPMTETDAAGGAVGPPAVPEGMVRGNGGSNTMSSRVSPGEKESEIFQVVFQNQNPRYSFKERKVQKQWSVTLGGNSCHDKVC